MAGMNFPSEQNNSRRVIDVAVGILVGLKGCSVHEAFDELVSVVKQSGIGIGTIAAGLVTLAAGSSSSVEADVFAAWGDLVGRNRPLLQSVS